MTAGHAGQARSPCSASRRSPRLRTGRRSWRRSASTPGIHNINAELASTPQQREIGLMFRTRMPANDGMLFVFEQPGQQCFWMRNTLIPLSVAFIGDDGSVVNIDDMKPQTLDSHCSAKPVRFVLEMNEGWFAKRGIKAGSRLRGGPFGH
jgi:uncharacterized membrane protein (UPF0127 family)